MKRVLIYHEIISIYLIHGIISAGMIQAAQSDGHRFFGVTAGSGNQNGGE